MNCEFRNEYGLFYRFCLALLLCGVFIVEPVAAGVGIFSIRSPIYDDYKSSLSPDQRIVPALSRLTFGRRPGDFERLQRMGVKAYINEQLEADSIDDSALDKRLEKLPTLMLMTPTIAEQYNPPKPPPAPVPVMPGDIIEFKVVGAEQFNFKATVNPEGKIEV